MNKRIMSIFLVIALLVSYSLPVHLVYAEDEYTEHVQITNNGEVIEKKEIKVGETLDIYAKVVDDEGNEDTYWDDLDGEDKSTYTQYKWSSKDEKIATATPDDYSEDIGNITGISAGTVKIKVESIDCKNCEPKEIEITVIDDKPKYDRHVVFRNKPEKTEIKVGETLDLYAMVADDAGNEDTDGEDESTYTQYKWSSEDEKIATATPDDYSEDIGNITGMSAGIVKIKIESIDCKNCEPKEIEITVIEDQPTQEEGEIDRIDISLDKDIKEIECGKNIKLNVVALDKNIKEINNPEIKWEIEPEDAAMIDNQNIMSTLKEGDISIKAIGETKDKNIVVSNIITLKVINSKTREEKIKEAIDELILRYKNPKYYGSDFISDHYTGKLALALRYSGMNIEEINHAKNIFRTDAGEHDLLNTSKNIMTLIAVNEDPIKEVEKILDHSFVFYEDINEEKVDKLIYAIIALDMADVDYNKEKAVKKLMDMTTKDTDGGIYFERYDYPDVELTAKALIALSKHKDINGVTDTINGIKKYLKSVQSESGLIKEVTSFSNEESCKITSEVIQGIIALGEDPLDEYWTIKDQYKNKNNLVDAMLSCRDGQRFKNSPDGSVANIQTDSALAALVDLKEKDSMYNNLKYVKAGDPFRIEIKNKDSVVLTEGDQLQIKAIVYDKKNCQIKNPAILWESLDESKAIVENGLVTALSQGQATIKVSVEGKPEVNDHMNINIKSGISDEILKEKLKKEIDFLKDHYKAYGVYEFLAAPSGVVLGIDKNEIQNKIQKYRVYTSVYQYSKLIISAIGAGIDPRSIEIEGSIKNSIDILRSSQVRDGENRGQFIVSPSDCNNIETLAYCIIALDMADADYDKEAAIKSLMNLLKDPDLKIKLGEDEVKIKAVALNAFANHKDIEGVTIEIESIIKLIKEKQNEYGGFGSKQGDNCIITTARVVQGLVANDINPLYSKEWMKNKKTVLDSMLKNKYEHPTDIDKSGFSKFEGGSRNFEATYYAFAAFADMYSNETIFKKLSIKNDGKIKEGDIEKISILPLEKNKLLVGQSVNITANAFDHQYNWIKNPYIVWSSSDEDIASVKNGVVYAKKTGNVTITASIANKSIKDEIHLTIEDLEIKNVKIQCNKNKIRKDDVILLNAKAFDKIDNEVKGVNYIWSVDDEKVANIYEEEGKTYLKALDQGKVVLKAALKDQVSINHEITIDIIEKKSAKIKIRVEGIKDLLVPETELEIDNFDMGSYGNGSSILKETPTAMNALIKVLESKNIDCTDKNKFDAGMDLTKLVNINGIKELGEGPNSGWMYCINDQYANDYFANMTIHDGDSICVFYVKDYQKQSYSYFDKTEVVVKPNEGFTLNLKTYVSSDMNDTKKRDVKNAQILVNEKPYMINEKNVVTDDLGNATLRFDQEGEYIIGATYKDKNLDIVAAYCKVKVTNDLENNKFEWSLLSKEDFHCGEEAKLKIKVKNKGIKPSNMICVIQLIDENNQVLKGSSVEKKLLDGEETILSPGFAIPDYGAYQIKVFLTDEKIDPSKPVKVISIN